MDGNEFVNLSEEEVKSIVPPIGIAKKIVRIIEKVRQVFGCV